MTPDEMRTKLNWLLESWNGFRTVRVDEAVVERMAGMIELAYHIKIIGDAEKSELEYIYFDKGPGTMTPQDDYISIAEFAKLAGMTPAGVYKQVNKPVNNELINYVKMIDGKKRISKAALSLFDKKVDKPVNKLIEEVYKPVDNRFTGNTGHIKGRTGCQKQTD